MESRTYELEGSVPPATPPHTGPGRPGEERRMQGGDKRRFTEETSLQEIAMHRSDITVKLVFYIKKNGKRRQVLSKGEMLAQTLPTSARSEPKATWRLGKRSGHDRE